MYRPALQVTPTFTLYRGGGGAPLATVTGPHETRLLRALVDALSPEERAAHAGDVAELEAAEAADAAAAAAAAEAEAQ